MIYFASGAAAAIPALLYVFIIYLLDRYEREPLWLVSAAFLWGAIPSIIVSLIFNTLFGVPFYLLFEPSIADATTASIIAPLVEESVKGFALIIILFAWHDEIDSILDGILYGAIVGMGFAMVENVFYFVEQFNSAGWEAWQTTVILRAVVFGFNHALFTSLAGLGIAISKLSHSPVRRVAAPIIGWGAAVFLHFVHNAAASSELWIGAYAFIPLLVNAWGGLAFMFCVVIWSLVQERRWLRRYLIDEMEHGVLTARQYEIAASGFNRFRHRWRLLLTLGPSAYLDARRFYSRCSKLAYAKHRTRNGTNPRQIETMQRLRGEIRRYGVRI